MAYRLRKHESVPAGLRRVVSKELQTAVKQLADPQPSDDAIHSARSSIKKVRAVLYLLRHEMETERDRKRLRSASRLLSPLRDADAMLAAATLLCDPRGSKLSAKTCAALDDVLKRRKDRLCRTAEHHRAARRAAKALKQVRRAVKDRPWKRVGFSALIAEVRRSYKRAKRQMGTVQDHQGAEDFHLWRKRVKTLWYALRLLETHATFGRLLADLERLETSLGEHQNLLTLRAYVSMSRRLTSARARIRALSKRQESALRRRAVATGRRLFGATPKTFVQRLRLSS